MATKAPAKTVPVKKAAPKATPAKAAKKAEVVTETQTVLKVGIKELAKAVHEGLPMVALATVERVTAAVFEKMVEAYAAGNVVNIKDFGKLAIVHRAAREARNPSTGETVQVPAKVVPKFVFAKKLKEMAA